LLTLFAIACFIIIVHLAHENAPKANIRTASQPISKRSVKGLPVFI
jgi:hypothetical protein